MSNKINNEETKQTTVETGSLQDNKTLNKGKNNTISSFYKPKNKRKKKISKMEIESKSNQSENNFKKENFSPSLW